ncbi:FAD:protein FMN transferase [Liquorilactobacillus mali]|uniref:FAD:protein FMN transferase n=1 Tax=Liquorilactobacillus mali TaxID=1618 RepID=UPI00264FB303|nr:FAD:protein FMN transferase [Liquorilactobacillus mali]MDN7146514.1 FAD:protein FMN transferase [Liquorilactobacillus mali]
MSKNDFKIYDRVINKMNIPFTLSIATTSLFNKSINKLIDQLAIETQKSLQQVDELFSTFRPDSLVKRYQLGDDTSLLNDKFKTVYDLSILGSNVTQGYFDPYFEGCFNPTGLVKGWAIEEIFFNILQPVLKNEPQILGISLNGGGDLQFGTQTNSPFFWKIGIENPVKLHQLVAIYKLQNGAVATSGFSKRGQHIVGLNDHSLLQSTIVASSLTWADIWATAALSAGETKFSKLLQREELTGLLVSNKDVIPFLKGRKADVEKL